MRSADQETTPRLGRRALLGWSGSAGLLGVAAGAAGTAGALGQDDRASGVPAAGEDPRLAPSDQAVADRSLPMGLAARVPAFGTILAFDLTPEARHSPRRARQAAKAFLRHLAGLADRAGSAPAPTGAASLDQRAADLQVTPGLGATLLDACGLAGHRPPALADLPSFDTDRLEGDKCGGDLMVQLAAEDPMRLAGAVQEVVSHARSALADDLRMRWSRGGFRGTAAAAQAPSTTSRNIMGHRDGTDNPPAGSPLWRIAVRASGPHWMEGGSYLVARQIRIDLDGWFAHGEADRDRVIGRRTSDGAPLGERHEDDQLVLTTTTPSGALAIPRDAHVRLANPSNTDGARIYRRSWNFDDGYVEGRRRAGLLFLAWQADVRRGFLPIQRALVQQHDALNRFTTHVGSAVFAAPARGDDDYVGQRLLEA